MTRLRLPAATPQDWFTTHLQVYLHEWDGDAVDETQRHWYSGAEAFADDLAILRRSHAGHLGDGATAQAAAKWVVGEHLNTAAEALAVLYVAAGAVAVDLDPLALRFGTHPEGWVQLVDLGEPRLIVIDGHPWAGQPGIDTVPDANALVGAFCVTIRPVAAPWLAAGKRLGKVGFSSLWAETSDAIGMCTMLRTGMPTGVEVLTDLLLLLDAPSAPWRKRPRLWLADVAGTDQLLGQKAGCCLSYLSDTEHGDDGGASGASGVADDAHDVRHQAYLEAFPQEAGALDYCSTCCFREVADTEARLRWEVEWDRHHRGPLAGGSVQAG